MPRTRLAASCSAERRACLRRMPVGGRLGVLAAGGFEVELFGEGGEEPGLPFGLAGEGGWLAFGGEVEDGPEFHEPVESVEAEQVLVPARAEGGGEMAVAGAVDLLDPGAEPAQGFLAFGSVEFPPPRSRGRLVLRRRFRSPRLPAVIAVSRVVRAATCWSRPSRVSSKADCLAATS